MRNKATPTRFLFVTKCDCCGEVASIVLPQEDGTHVHVDLYGLKKQQIAPMSYHDLALMKEVITPLNKQCEELVVIATLGTVIKSWRKQCAY